MVSNIVLYASEVASVCGLNPYKKRHDTFISVWKRIVPNLDVQTNRERIERLIPSNTISTFVNASSSAKNIREVKQVVQDIKCEITKIDNVTTSDKEEIIKCIESQVNCTFGTKQEDSAIAQYELNQKTLVTNRNDKFHKRKIIKLDRYTIYVGGKVDGIKEDGTVVEVKNRMRRFFNPLPQYDVAQLQTYLFILDSKKGELVEQLKEDTAAIRTTQIDRDEHMWNTIIEPRIVSFTEALIKAINDTELRQGIADSNEQDRENIINELMD